MIESWGCGGREKGIPSRRNGKDQGLKTLFLIDLFRTVSDKYP